MSLIIERRVPVKGFHSDVEPLAFWCPACNKLHNMERSVEVRGSEERPTVIRRLNFANPPRDGMPGLTSCAVHIMQGRLWYHRDSDHPLVGSTAIMVPINDDGVPTTTGDLTAVVCASKEDARVVSLANPGHLFPVWDQNASRLMGLMFRSLAIREGARMTRQQLDTLQVAIR